MRIRSVLAGLSLTLLLGVAGAARSEPAKAAAPQLVSLVSVIADPERYSDQLIVTEGVLSLEFEDVALYLSQEAYENVVKANSLGLRMKAADLEHSSPLRGKYVFVRGRVRVRKVDGKVIVGLQAPRILTLWSDPACPLRRSGCKAVIANVPPPAKEPAARSPAK